MGTNSPASAPWVRIRQVVLGVTDVAVASERIQQEFGLAPGFADPMLAEIGMADESIILGNGRTFLEFVGPLNPDASIQNWLSKGGPGGYALAIQVKDVEPLLKRAAELGIGTAADTKAYGYRIVQLRPKDVGLLVEFDEIPDVDAWFWDDVPKQIPSAPRVDDVTWIELASPEPAAQAAQWAALFGVDVVDDHGRLEISIGGTPAFFVAGPRPMMSGVGLKSSAINPLDPVALVLSGVRFDPGSPT